MIKRATNMIKYCDKTRNVNMHTGSYSNCCLKRTREILLDFTHKVCCQSHTTIIICLPSLDSLNEALNMKIL